jgi:hypothetical protein
MALKQIVFYPNKGDKFKPLGILNLPYLEDDGFYDKEVKSFLMIRGRSIPSC